MKFKSLILIATIAFAATPPVSAISIGLDRLLGTIEPGTPADPENEVNMINFLVNAYNSGSYANGTVHNLMDNPADSNTEVNFLNVSDPTELPSFGDLNTTVLANHTAAGGNNIYNINTGGLEYEWLTAKYGNRTAVFFIGGLTGAITVPNFDNGSAAPLDYFQGAGNGNGYGLSGTDFYNRIPAEDEEPLPDGGTTAILMGLSLFGLTGIKKFLRRK